MGMTEEDRQRLKGGITIEPTTASVPGIQTMFGLSRSAIYRHLAAGDIKAVKNGGRTLIIVATVRDYMASLPAATFRQPGKSKSTPISAA